MRRLVSLTALAVLALAAPASAALPRPLTTTKIKIGSAMAGVGLGMATETAINQWRGDSTSCNTDPPVLPTFSGTCYFAGADSQAYAQIDMAAGKVSAISIHGRDNGKRCVAAGPVGKWKDAKGVGLGTSIKTVGKKYKKARETATGFRLDSGKKSTIWETIFGRVCAITVTRRSG